MARTTSSYRISYGAYREDYGSRASSLRTAWPTRAIAVARTMPFCKAGGSRASYPPTERSRAVPMVSFSKEFRDYCAGTRKKEYRARKHICTGCPLRSSCLGKSAQEKKFSVTYYRAKYFLNIVRVESPLGRYMKGKGQSRVEPVFGTLTQFMGQGKINTVGFAKANKVMHLSAIAYNLKTCLPAGRST